jgi:transcriptional regulator NrdR family protein
MNDPDRPIKKLLEKLTCPHCGGMESKVIDSRQDAIHGQYRRRRQCKCGSRYMTVEIVVAKVTTSRGALS